MTPRQRFNAIMRFQRPDALPLWDVEGVSESAVRQWVRDGHVPLGVRAADAVGFDPRTIIHLDTAPLPAFVTRTLQEDDEYRTFIDPYGFTVRESKVQAVGPTYYAYLAGSVHSREDWEAMKHRFDPADPRRRPRDWSGELLENLSRSDGPVGLRIDWGPGRGIKNGYMMGLETFLQTLADEPDFVAGVFEFWADFVIALARDWLAGGRFDLAYFCEDGMGFKHSTLVGPETFRRVWGPPLRRVVEFLRSGGVDFVGYYTSGNVEPLIGALLDLGINFLQPLECAAGMDAPDLRRRYGRDLRLIGNISRQALMDGPEAVQREFARKVPPLMESGGYVPAIDDLVMPDMPFASIRRYVELVRSFRP